MKIRIFTAGCIFFMMVMSTCASAQVLSIKAVAPDKRIMDYKVYNHSKALLIGNSKYAPSRGWDALPSIPGEIASIKSALLRQGFQEANSEITNDTNASKLRETFRSFLLAPVNRETRLLVYYAGHGFSPDDIKGFLVPTDAPAESDPNFESFLLGMSEIIDWSKRSRAKHALFVFDSCFSGTIFLTRSRNLKPNQLFLNEAEQPVRQFLTAGSARERVPAVSDFAQKLVKGLDGAADLYPDGVVTANELGYWLKAELIPLGKQTPQYGSLTDSAYRFGDTIFTATQGASAPASSLPLTTDPKSMLGQVSAKGATRSALGVPSTSAPAGFQGVDVYYYQKAGDMALVSNSLDRANIPFVKTLASLPQKELTNALACGPDVPVDALKAVAHALISGGVTLNTITPVASPNQKLRRLEVLTNRVRTGSGLRVWGAGGITAAQVDQLSGCPS